LFIDVHIRYFITTLYFISISMFNAVASTGVGNHLPAWSFTCCFYFSISCTDKVKLL